MIDFPNEWKIPQCENCNATWETMFKCLMNKVNYNGELKPEKIKEYHEKTCFSKKCVVCCRYKNNQCCSKHLNDVSLEKIHEFTNTFNSLEPEEEPEEKPNVKCICICSSCIPTPLCGCCFATAEDRKICLQTFSNSERKRYNSDTSCKGRCWKCCNYARTDKICSFKHDYHNEPFMDCFLDDNNDLYKLEPFGRMYHIDNNRYYRYNDIGDKEIFIWDGAYYYRRINGRNFMLNNEGKHISA